MHAKGHIRDAFLNPVYEQVLDARWSARDAEVEGRHGGEPLAWGRVVGLLWNPTDVVPRHACEILGFPQGSSYAQVVRGMEEPLGFRNL